MSTSEKIVSIGPEQVKEACVVERGRRVVVALILQHMMRVGTGKEDWPLAIVGELMGIGRVHA
jgi:hypothetical protein